MKKFKKVLLTLPEYLLIAAVIFYWLSAGMTINPVAIGLLIILILQIIFKNKVLGLIIPSLLIMTCLYMLMALISEFNEFPTFNADAKKLLFVGLSYFILTMIISVLMIYKYSRIKSVDSTKIETS